MLPPPQETGSINDQTGSVNDQTGGISDQTGSVSDQTGSVSDKTSGSTAEENHTKKLLSQGTGYDDTQTTNEDPTKTPPALGTEDIQTGHADPNQKPISGSTGNGDVHIQDEDPTKNPLPPETGNDIMVTPKESSTKRHVPQQSGNDDTQTADKGPIKRLLQETGNTDTQAVDGGPVKRSLQETGDDYTQTADEGPIKRPRQETGNDDIQTADEDVVMTPLSHATGRDISKPSRETPDKKPSLPEEAENKENWIPEKPADEKAERDKSPEVIVILDDDDDVNASLSSGTDEVLNMTPLKQPAGGAHEHETPNRLREMQTATQPDMVISGVPPTVKRRSLLKDFEGEPRRHVDSLNQTTPKGRKVQFTSAGIGALSSFHSGDLSQLNFFKAIQNVQNAFTGSSSGKGHLLRRLLLEETDTPSDTPPDTLSHTPSDTPSQDEKTAEAPAFKWEDIPLPLSLKMLLLSSTVSDCPEDERRSRIPDWARSFVLGLLKTQDSIDIETRSGVIKAIEMLNQAIVPRKSARGSSLTLNETERQALMNLFL